MRLSAWAAAGMLAVMVAPAQAQAPFALEVVAEGLDQPVFLTAPAGDPRLFVVEQTGRILILREGEVAAAPFADFSDLIVAGGEQGLLGLAFHPDHAANGRFYVNYTDRSGDTRVVGYRVSADPDVADLTTGEQVLTVEQPRSNHNGGWIGFGPDGQLYVGMGDGGGAGDTRNYAQTPDTLLGKMVRIDVDGGGAPEIFLSGLRNPWRNAWDGDDLYIADVGQSAWEEINIVGLDDAGGNLGWRVLEGEACFAEAGCSSDGYIMPVHVYSHEVGCSITGGEVYRGTAIPEIEGLYFFADYCSGELFALRKDGEEIAEVLSYADAFGSIGQVTSFGRDAEGELYLLTQDGVIRKFVAAR